MSTIPPDVVSLHNARLQCQFNDYCHLTTKLLSDNPQGLTLPIIQSKVGMSAKTAKRVLAGVADEKDGKYYPKSKGARK